MDFFSKNLDSLQYMLLHTYLYFTVLENYLHSQEIMFVSSCLGHFTELTLDLCDYLVNDFGIRMTNFVVVNVPDDSALLAFYVSVGNA